MAMQFSPSHSLPNSLESILRPTFLHTCGLFLLLCNCLPPAAIAQKLVLKDGWEIQPSRDVPDKGETISTTAFQPRQWYRTSMPSTVVAAMVSGREYADPYFGMNMRSLPGSNYTIGITSS